MVSSIDHDTDLSEEYIATLTMKQRVSEIYLIENNLMARNFGHARAVNIQTWKNLKQYGYTKL